jgi:hypothetical protein
VELKKLESAGLLLQAVKKIDAEIEEINRMAMLIANGVVELDFTLNTIDVVEKAKQESASYEESGPFRGLYDQLKSMNTGFLFGMQSPYGLAANERAVPAGTSAYKSRVTESCALQILGCLLGEKQSKRSAVMQQLADLGFKV